MIDTRLRAKFQPLFDALAKGFVRLKIKPNQITVLALILGIFAGAMVAYDRLVLAIILLWISGLLDVLDGTVARLTKHASSLGAYIDLIFDRMVEAGVILGFYFLLPENALVYLLFFISVLFNFTTFIVAGVLFENSGNKSMHYDIGLAERTETFIVFTSMMLMPSYVFIILAIFIGIIVLRGIIRFVRILKDQS